MNVSEPARSSNDASQPDYTTLDLPVEIIATSQPDLKHSDLLEASEPCSSVDELPSQLNGFSPHVEGLPSGVDELPSNIDELSSPGDSILPPPIEALQIDEIEPPQSPIGTRNDSQTADEGIFSSPRASPMMDSPRRWEKNAKSGTEPSFRARAEEVNPGSKVVPQIDVSPGDFFSMDVEIEAWFHLSEVKVSDWLRTEASSAELKRILLTDPPLKSVAEIRNRIVDECTKLMQNKNWVHDLDFDFPLEDFNAQTLLLFCLLTAIHSGTLLLDNGVPILATLIEQIAALRWDIGMDDFADTDSSSSVAPKATHLSRVFFLARMSILATFGDSESLKQTKNKVWQSFRLSMDNDDPESADSESASYASPIYYASFMEEVTSRYPSYTHHEDEKQLLGSRLKRMNGSLSKGDNNETDNMRYGRESSVEDPSSYPPDPRDLVNSANSVIPYVPESIIEACALFKSRVKLSPSILQLYNEYRNPNDPQSVEVDEKLMKIPQVRSGWDLYKRTLTFQKSFVRVVIDFSLQKTQMPNAAVHAALATLWHLLRWFECTHVLMFENLSALAFDCQFHLFSHLFCTKHPRIQQYVLEDFPISNFWREVAGGKMDYDGVPLHTDMESTDLTITLYNKYNLQTFTHLMGICRMMTMAKTQRLIVVAELPVDPYKPLLSIYEKYLWLQMLQYLKSQVPFTGRRWRYLNMEIISAIYLYVPSTIDDTWLSGSDMSPVIKTATQEEETLRDIILAFNEKLQ